MIGILVRVYARPFKTRQILQISRKAQGMTSTYYKGNYREFVPTYIIARNDACGNKTCFVKVSALKLSRPICILVAYFYDAFIRSDEIYSVEG
jgi:hypothetical protein